MKQHRIEVIDDDYAAVLRSKTPTERIAMANAAHLTAQTIIRSVIEQLHPDWTADQKHAEFLKRLLGDGATEYLASRSKDS